MEPNISQEYLENSQSLFSNENGDILAIKVRLGLSYSGDKATNINIILNLPNNLYTQENPIFIENIKGNSTPYNHEFSLYCLNNEFPYKNSFDIQISYYNAMAGKGEFRDSRCLTKEVNIPSGFQYKCVPPVKNATFKITVGLNQEIQVKTRILKEKFIYYLNSFTLYLKKSSANPKKGKKFLQTQMLFPSNSRTEWIAQSWWGRQQVY